MISVFLPLCFYTLSKRKCRSHLKNWLAAIRALLIIFAGYMRAALVAGFLSVNHLIAPHTCMYILAKSSVHDVHFKYFMLTHEHVFARVYLEMKVSMHFCAKQANIFHMQSCWDGWAVKQEDFWSDLLISKPETWAGLQSRCVEPLHAEPWAMHCGNCYLTFHPGRHCYVFHINWSLFALIYSL